MKKPMLITIQIAVLVIIGAAGIIYILNSSPVESLGEYEKQEMARPNKSQSLIDNFFSSSEKDASDDADDDSSLTGPTGGYEESRIGKSPY